MGSSDEAGPIYYLDDRQKFPIHVPLLAERLRGLFPKLGQITIHRHLHPFEYDESFGWIIDIDKTAPDAPTTGTVYSVQDLTRQFRSYQPVQLLMYPFSSSPYSLTNALQSDTSSNERETRYQPDMKTLWDMRVASGVTLQYTSDGLELLARGPPLTLAVIHDVMRQLNAMREEGIIDFKELSACEPAPYTRSDLASFLHDALATWAFEIIDIGSKLSHIPGSTAINNTEPEYMSLAEFLQHLPGLPSGIQSISIACLVSTGREVYDPIPRAKLVVRDRLHVRLAGPDRQTPSPTSTALIPYLATSARWPTS